MWWIWDWAEYHNKHSSKIIRVIKLSFCQNVPPMRHHFGKRTVWSLLYFLNYICLLWYLSQSQIHRITLYDDSLMSDNQKRKLESMNSLSENSSTECEPSDSKRHSKLLINDLWAQRKIGTRGEYNFTFNLARKRLCRNDMYWTAQRKKDLKTIGFIMFCLALRMRLLT